jgi:integrase
LAAKVNAANTYNKRKGKFMKRRAAQPDSQQFMAALRTASPEMIAAALKILHNGNGGKKRKKKCRFFGSDHFISKEQLAAICAASSPLYATLWRLCAAHALRISEALATRACDIQNGFITVRRLKGSQTTTQKLLVNLDEQINSGTYRLFPLHRSSAFLHFRKAATKIGLHPDLRHPHVLRHSSAHWLLDGGTPLHVASQWLGHTSLASTSAYLQVSDAKASSAAALIIGTL